MIGFNAGTIKKRREDKSFVVTLHQYTYGDDDSVATIKKRDVAVKSGSLIEASKRVNNSLGRRGLNVGKKPQWELVGVVRKIF